MHKLLFKMTKKPTIQMQMKKYKRIFTIHNSTTDYAAGEGEELDDDVASCQL